VWTLVAELLSSIVALRGRHSTRSGRPGFKLSRFRGTRARACGPSPSGSRS
jgi:hypothetical protein